MEKEAEEPIQHIIINASIHLLLLTFEREVLTFEREVLTFERKFSHLKGKLETKMFRKERTAARATAVGLLLLFWGLKKGQKWPKMAKNWPKNMSKFYIFWKKDHTQEGTDSCQGDSGGPLVVMEDGRWSQYYK